MTKKINKYIMTLLLLAFIVVVIHFMLEGEKRGQEFFTTPISGVVEHVEYRNKINQITLISGENIAFTLDFNYREMEKYYGVHFSDFIFIGDSIIKARNSNKIYVKKRNGSRICLYF